MANDLGEYHHGNGIFHCVHGRSICDDTFLGMDYNLGEYHHGNSIFRCITFQAICIKLLFNPRDYTCGFYCGRALDMQDDGYTFLNQGFEHSYK